MISCVCACVCVSLSCPVPIDFSSSTPTHFPLPSCSIIIAWLRSIRYIRAYRIILGQTYVAGRICVHIIYRLPRARHRTRPHSHHHPRNSRAAARIPRRGVPVHTKSPDLEVHHPRPAPKASGTATCIPIRVGISNLAN